MMIEKTAGYREIPHTADWELLVWAPDMATLMVKAAKGMYALSGTRLAEGPRSSLQFEFPYPGPRIPPGGFPLRTALLRGRPGARV